MCIARKQKWKDSSECADICINIYISCLSDNVQRECVHKAWLMTIHSELKDTG